ncbi:MAG: HD domain-containing protein [Lachnospiraceae bacterium]|nr:HD domain-containing protein [Lachnospiraceae bacterium]
MRYVPLNEVKPGMISTGSLYDYDGKMFIKNKAVLSKEDIDKIKEYGYQGIYINDELTADIVVEDVISPNLRSKGLFCVRDRDIDGCKKVARKIVSEIVSKGQVSLDMTDLRTYDNFTYAHSVNVAVYACVIGIGLHYDEKDLKNLVTAALLHDLGKLTIPEDIINKPGRLTKEEYNLIKKHPTLSYELIKDDKKIPSEVKEAVLSHHENEDGTGYPNGTRGESQSEFTQILHVADVYDALVSERPYKKPYSPYEAAEYMMGGSGIMFNQRMVESLLDFVPLYPKGTRVTLSNGKKGIIMKNDGLNNLRPVIKMDNGATLDLTLKQYLSLTIINSGFLSGKNLEEDEIKRKEMVEGDKAAKKHIMLIDDDMSHLNQLGIILEEEYMITAFRNGRDAINYILEKNTPDLVIIDLDMPIMTGEETADEINEMSNGEIPLMFAADENDERTIFACAEYKSKGYILRPYNTTYIRTEVGKAFAKFSIED